MNCIFSSGNQTHNTLSGHFNQGGLGKKNKIKVYAIAIEFHLIQHTTQTNKQGLLNTNVYRWLLLKTQYLQICDFWFI